MTARDRLRWKAWADSLRQTMMTELTTSVTKSVSQIIAETATEKSVSVLGTQRFWKTLQAGNGGNDTLVQAGFDIEFTTNEEGKVEAVTLQLNDTWTAILQRVLDRRLLLKSYRMENGLMHMASEEIDAESGHGH